MAYRALDTIMLGSAPPAQAGEILPAHYTDTAGQAHPVDVERLVEIGAAEKISEPKAPRRRTGKET